MSEVSEIPVGDLRRACAEGDLGALARALGEAAVCEDFSLDTPLPGEGQTLLILAARTGQAAVVRELINRGARLDVEVEGLTALDCAATHSANAETLQLLLAAGADANRADGAGTRPLVAVVMTSPTVGASGRQTRLVAADKVRALLAAGADPALAVAAGATAHRWAEYMGYEEAAEILAAASA